MCVKLLVLSGSTNKTNETQEMELELKMVFIRRLAKQQKMY